jgi:hypothetical protein
MLKKRRRLRLVNSICGEAAEPPIIDLAAAARIYRTITGSDRSSAFLAAELERYPYMAVSIPRGDIRKVVGVMRERWIYFLTVRKALYGRRRVFDCYPGFEV